MSVATRGEFLSSCKVKVRPDNKAVRAAGKCSGDMLKLRASAAECDGLRSDVPSANTRE
jgi:hypothetical protein